MKTAVLTGYAFQMPPEKADRHEVWMKPMRPRELIAEVEVASAKAGNGSVSRATIGCPGLEQLAAPTRKCGQPYFSVSFAAPPRSCDFREAAYTVATGAVLSISSPVGAVKRYTVSNAKSV
jgi:hypothetical protein